MLRGVVTNVSGCSWLLFMVLKLNAAPVVNPRNSISSHLKLSERKLLFICNHRTLGMSHLMLFWSSANPSFIRMRWSIATRSSITKMIILHSLVMLDI